MSAKHAHTVTLSVRHIQTLSHSYHVCVVDMRIWFNKEFNSAVLITAGIQGSIVVYSSPLSHAQSLQFTLRKRFQAHSNVILCVHFHYSKPLFVSSGYDNKVNVWNLKDITTPRLIQCLPHSQRVWSTKYSQSGLLLTASYAGVLRVYGKEPLFSLCWTFKTFSRIWSIAWSPSNRICAVFESGISYVVQVWDSSFQTLFQLQQDSICNSDGVLFASNDLLLSAGGRANKLYWYHISKPKVMKVFEKDLLPFCRDVLKIIIQYLPFVAHNTHVTH